MGVGVEPIIIIENAIKLSINSRENTIGRLSCIYQTRLMNNYVHRQIHATPDYFGVTDVSFLLKSNAELDIQQHTLNVC